MLPIHTALVSVNWLDENLNNNKLVVLDCTLPAKQTQPILQKGCIKGALPFNITAHFSDTTSSFPNTILQPKVFENKVQTLGIFTDSIVVCYDAQGIYSSARAWFNFKTMGFANVFVLNGGYPAWLAKNYPIEYRYKVPNKIGNFKAIPIKEKLKYTTDVLENITSKKQQVIDARSAGRFNGTAPEPRKGLPSGHMPNALNLPFTEVLENGFLKPKTELQALFKELETNKDFIFTCGSGITACILALAADEATDTNYAVYDGSWTEWALTSGLPIKTLH